MSKQEIEKIQRILQVTDRLLEHLPEQEIEKFIKSHNTCALATGYDDKIRCTPIEYLYLTGMFYIISEGGEKFANIMLNKNVSLSIFVIKSMVPFSVKYPCKVSSLILYVYFAHGFLIL